MNCLQVCEVLSAAHDGESVDPTMLTEARTHSETCRECAEFVTLLDRLDTAPAPRASEDLLSRLHTRTAPVAADLRAEPSRPTAEEPRHAEVHRLRPRTSWVPRFAAFASAAAVIVVALTVGGIVLIGGLGQTAEEQVAEESLRTAETAPMGSADSGAAAESDAAAVLTQAVAPAYITFGTEVWMLVQAAEPDPSSLVTAGIVTSTLDGTGGDNPAYFAGADTSALFVKTIDGRHFAFERVVRTLGRAEYVLTSGTQITSFGMWPTLPERFEQPQDSDGSPTFRYFGFDDEHLDVYVPPGGRIEDGFALAPGSPIDDPAAGNPNWTWWERLE
jgi:negative regulator of sigma E activity